MITSFSTPLFYIMEAVLNFYYTHKGVFRMKQPKKWIQSALVGTMLVTGGLISPPVTSQAHAQTQNQQSFKDIKPTDYFADAVNWAKNNNIIGGYSDGTFRPYANVTEAQFAKMLAQYFKATPAKETLPITGIPEQNTYYSTLATYSVPLNGYFDNTIRNTPVKRGVVAQALAYIGGYDDDTSLKTSINFLLDNDITTGQNTGAAPNDLNGLFGTHNLLTRGQVVTFLYRMNNANLKNINIAAVQEQINMNDYSLKQLAINGKKKVDKTLLVGATPEDEVIVDDNNIGVTESNKVSHFFDKKLKAGYEGFALGDEEYYVLKNGADVLTYSDFSDLTAEYIFELNTKAYHADADYIYDLISGTNFGLAKADLDKALAAIAKQGKGYLYIDIAGYEMMSYVDGYVEIIKVPITDDEDE